METVSLAGGEIYPPLFIPGKRDEECMHNDFSTCGPNEAILIEFNKHFPVNIDCNY
jgi:hypothetical protein